MANYKNGINGPFSGKVGHVVGVERNGKNYMRSLPDTSGQEPSEKQIKQRKLLALVSSWLRPLKNIIKIGFQGASPGKTPMNEAFALNYREAVVEADGEAKIDFPKVILSRGELLISFILEFLSLLQNKIHIKWENARTSAFNKENDKASFVVYNPNKERFVSFVDAADRIDKETVLQLPDDFSGDTIHCWMQYANADDSKSSSSIYLGELRVG